MILPISLTTAGAAAILNLWLAARTVRNRMPNKILHGDGGDQALLARMRAHANFVEYTPFALILIALIEFARGTSLALWILSILYLVARLVHPFGMDKTQPNAPRALGFIVTWLVLAALAAWALAIPYMAPVGPVQMEIVPVG